jgi:hypothetical protein
MDPKIEQSKQSHEDIVERLETWVSDQGGAEELRQAIQDAQACTEDLQRKRRLDSSTLNEPFTV